MNEFTAISGSDFETGSRIHFADAIETARTSETRRRVEEEEWTAGRTTAADTDGEVAQTGTADSCQTWALIRPACHGNSRHSSATHSTQWTSIVSNQFEVLYLSDDNRRCYRPLISQPDQLLLLSQTLLSQRISEQQICAAAPAPAPDLSLLGLQLRLLSGQYGELPIV